ncbi:hypothetical protein Tco_1116104 [Tanacetum coccineum]
MSQYIKNIGSHTLKHLKSYSFDEIKNLFEATIRRVHTFVPMESESERVIPEFAAGSSKRDAEEELVQERMNVEALQTKYPIIDWEIYTEGARKYWKIIRVGNHTEISTCWLKGNILCQEVFLHRCELQNSWWNKIMKCPENFLGRSSCWLKGPEDEVFGRILSKNKILIQET